MVVMACAAPGELLEEHFDGTMEVVKMNSMGSKTSTVLQMWEPTQAGEVVPIDCLDEVVAFGASAELADLRDAAPAEERRPAGNGSWLAPSDCRSQQPRQPSHPTTQVEAVEVLEGVDSWTCLERQSPSQARETAWSQGGMPAAACFPGARYADKGRGLSLNERLEQLGLTSDSEEEDEAQGHRQLANSAGSPRGAAPEPGEPSAAVVVEEAVQEFVLESDEDDD